MFFGGRRDEPAAFSTGKERVYEEHIEQRQDFTAGFSQAVRSRGHDSGIGWAE
jgi:hypothetical protein